MDRVDIEPDVKPDNKGLVKWVVSVKPNEKKTHRIEYTIEYPRDIFLKRQAQTLDGTVVPMPSIRDMSEDISIQIEDLEAKF